MSLNNYICVWRSCLVAFAIAASIQPVAAQETLEMHLPFTTITDAEGNDPTDPDAPLYRRGTGNPLTDKDGNSVSFGQMRQMVGEITIEARPEGGTDISITASNLLPNELYTVWAGYWQDPGHPTGERVGFGAVSKDNTGLDNAAYSDENGNITFRVVQEAGPMTIQGSAPSYAPYTPIETEPDVFEDHAGYAIGIAYHLGDFDPEPAEGWLLPGTPETWVLHGLAEFPPIPRPVPEPSGDLLMPLVGLTLLSRRRRTRA